MPLERSEGVGSTRRALVSGTTPSTAGPRRLVLGFQPRSPRARAASPESLPRPYLALEVRLRTAPHRRLPPRHLSRPCREAAPAVSGAAPVLAFGVFMGDAEPLPGFPPRLGETSVEVVVIRLIVGRCREQAPPRRAQPGRLRAPGVSRAGRHASAAEVGARRPRPQPGPRFLSSASARSSSSSSPVSSASSSPTSDSLGVSSWVRSSTRRRARG